MPASRMPPAWRAGRLAGTCAIGLVFALFLLETRANRPAPVVAVSVQVPVQVPTASGRAEPVLTPPGWQREARVTVADLRACDEGPDPLIAYAVGTGGTILRHYASPDRGWTSDASGTSADLNGVAEMLGSVCAVGASGVATCMLDPATSTWKVENTRTRNDLLGVGVTEARFFAVGRHGTILRSVGAGEWTEESSGDADLHAVLGDRFTDPAYVLGPRGTILAWSR